MTTPKTMTLRLAPELSKLLTTVARVERLSQAAVIRRALDGHLRARAAEPSSSPSAKQHRPSRTRPCARSCSRRASSPTNRSARSPTSLIPAEQVADYLAHLDD